MIIIYSSVIRKQNKKVARHIWDLSGIQGIGIIVGYNIGVSSQITRERSFTSTTVIAVTVSGFP